MRTLALTLAILLVPCAALAQSKAGKIGMIREGNLFYYPTPQTALEHLLIWKDHEPALAVLTQQFDAWPASELDAFADELVQVMLESEDASASWNARAALYSAGKALGGGTPYARSVAIFVGLYEAARAEDNRRAELYLLAVYHSGGEDYVLNLFEASPMPPSCRPGFPEGCPRTGPWCDAAVVLLSDDKLSDPKLWEDRCAFVVE